MFKNTLQWLKCLWLDFFTSESLLEAKKDAQHYLDNWEIVTISVWFSFPNGSCASLFFKMHRLVCVASCFICGSSPPVSRPTTDFLPLSFPLLFWWPSWVSPVEFPCVLESVCSFFCICGFVFTSVDAFLSLWIYFIGLCLLLRPFGFICLLWTAWFGTFPALYM